MLKGQPGLKSVARRLSFDSAAGAQFTCFTSTTVSTNTRAWRDASASTLLQALSLLTLLDQEYKYWHLTKAVAHTLAPLYVDTQTDREITT
jgi:hypothetical protein